MGVNFQHHANILIQVIEHFYSGEATPVQKWKNRVDDISFQHIDIIIVQTMGYIHIAVSHRVCATSEKTCVQSQEPDLAS